MQRLAALAGAERRKPPVSWHRCRETTTETEGESINQLIDLPMFYRCHLIAHNITFQQRFNIVIFPTHEDEWDAEEILRHSNGIVRSLTLPTPARTEQWWYSDVEPGSGWANLTCSFCKKMTLEALCGSEGYQHARSGEELWRVLQCRICRGKLWPGATELLSVLERPNRESLSGINLHIEQSKSGSVLKAYLDGSVLTPKNSNGRPLICYVTVEEGK